MIPSIDDILADDNLTTSKKMLLIVLARHAHSDGTGCYPSLRRLAHLSSLSLAHVCTLLAALETTGYLRIERFKGPKGVNAYVLHKRSAPESGAPESGAPESGARSPGAPVSGTEVQSEERKDPKVLFQPEEHQPVVLQPSVLHSPEHQSVEQTRIEVTEKAARLVSTWVSQAFSQVLQGKDPEASVTRPPAPPPRKFPFDAKRFALGDPCPDNTLHRYGDTGQSLRFIDDGACRACTLAAKKAARQPQP